MSLSETIANLKKGREAFTAAHPKPLFEGLGGAPTRLRPLEERFTNPGDLRAFYHAPEGLPAGAPLLVVLHGCTQDAAAYDRGAGWSALADRHGFALLYPEQKRENNPNLCFNWFQGDDVTRGSGEAASIAAMVEALKSRLDIDPRRVFVTGLSAGGAMAAAMIATYPDVFAGGAIIAGVPYGCASNVAEAFGCMGGRAPGDAASLSAKVRRASDHQGEWPRVSIWQGSADRIVSPANAEAMVLQWTGVHGLRAEPDRVDRVEGHERRVWLKPDGTKAIEYIEVQGMAHGTPLMPGTGEGESGQAQAHMLDVGISSTDRIAAFFGIAPSVGERPSTSDKPAGERVAARQLVGEPIFEPKVASPPPSGPGAVNGVQKTIEDALRSAGLMK